MRHVGLEELKQSVTDGRCWVAVQGKVYDVGPLLGGHPGGAQALLQAAGTDGTATFASAHDVDKIMPRLGAYEIGVLMRPEDSCPFALFSQLATAGGAIGSGDDDDNDEDDGEDRDVPMPLSIVATVKHMQPEITSPVPANEGDKHNKRIRKLNSFLAFLTDNDHLLAFTTAFYKQLLQSAPTVQRLFDGAQMAKTAMKFGKLFGQLVGTANMGDDVLKSFVDGLSLQHIQYGVKPAHIEPFGKWLLHTVEHFARDNAFPWTATSSEAWRWLWDRVAGVFGETLEQVAPKVLTIQKGWERLRYQSKLTASSRSSKKGSSSSARRFGSSLRVKRSVQLGHKPSTSSHSSKSGQPHSTDSEELELADFLTEIGGEFNDLFKMRLGPLAANFKWPPKQEIGYKMGKALDLIVRLASSSQVQMELELRRLATYHVKRSIIITPDMMELFGSALLSFLRTQLHWKGKSGALEEVAWSWLWQTVRQNFSRHLSNAKTYGEALAASHKIMADGPGIGELSNRFFKSLFAEAPDLGAYFYKPLAQQTNMFAEAIAFMLSASSDPETLSEGITRLALRHIRYRLEPTSLQLFGQHLIESIASFLKELVQDPAQLMVMTEAWSDLWEHIYGVFIGALAVPEAEYLFALSTGTEQQLMDALDAFPRGFRAPSCLHITVQGCVQHPLLMVLEAGHEGKLRLLLADLLCIRGDRETYYCGRDELWAAYPNLVDLLFTHCPVVVRDLLDHHVWASDTVVEGERRVNFYFKHFWGSPAVYNNASKAPLARLACADDHLALLHHPLVRYVSDLKWKLIGRTHFILRQSVALCSLLLFAASDFVVSETAGLACAICWIAVVLLRLAYTVRQLFYLRRAGNRVSREFAYLNLLSCSISLLHFVWRIVGGEMGSWTVFPEIGVFRAFAALNWFLMVVELHEAFKLSRGLASFLFTFKAMASDIVRFFLLYTLFLIAVGGAVHLLQEPVLGAPRLNSFGELLHKMLFKNWALSSDGSVDIFSESDSHLLVIAVAVSQFMAAIILLNLLISSMVLSYEHVQQVATDLAAQDRVKLVVEIELLLSVQKRQQIFDSLGLDAPLEFDFMDAGISGGHQVISPLSAPGLSQSHFRDSIRRSAGISGADHPWPSRLQAFVQTWTSGTASRMSDADDDSASDCGSDTQSDASSTSFADSKLDSEEPLVRLASATASSDSDFGS